MPAQARTPAASCWALRALVGAVAATIWEAVGDYALENLSGGDAVIAFAVATAAHFAAKVLRLNS